jgi:MFS family permease
MAFVVADSPNRSDPVGVTRVTLSRTPAPILFEEILMPEFNRWSLSAVFACAIGLALAFGTVIIATFGLFMMAMSRDFGWGMGHVSGLLAVAAFSQAPFSMPLGRLIDRVGVRAVVLPGIVLYGASVMALAAANGSTVQIYFLFALVGVTSSTVTMLPYSKVITGWFNARRGLMLSAYAVLAAVFGAAVPQAARWLIDAYGWRNAYLGLGAGVIGIGLPVLAILLHEPARRTARATEAAANGMTARQARATSTYWRIIVAITLCSIAVTGVYAHIAPLLVERGLSRATATNAVSLYVLASIVAQLTTGLLLDRSRSPRVAVPVLALALGGLLLLYFADTPVEAVTGGVLMGASVGAEVSLAKFLHARYFGNRAFGELFGLQFLFIGLSAGVGPIALGALHDATGSYQVGILSSAGLLFASILIISRLPHYARVPVPLEQTARADETDGAATAVPLRKLAL